MSQIPISKLKEIILDEYQKLTEGVELFTKDDVKKNRDAIVKIFNKVIPYADGIGIGVSKESIIGKFSLDKKNTWPNGYIENSRCGMFTLYNDGELKIEILSWGTYNQRKKVPKFRKSKVKSIEQAVAKSIKHLKLLTNKKYSLDVLPEGKLSEVNQKNLYVADQRYVGKYIIWVLSDNRSFRTAIMGKKGFDRFSSNDTDDLFKLWNLAKKFKGKPIPDIATEGKLTEGKLQQAMRQWKNVEDYLNPKQKKFIKKHYNSMKSKFKYFKPEDYADYIEGELDVKVPPQEFNNKKAIEFGQLVLAYSGAIKEPKYYNEGKLNELKTYEIILQQLGGKKFIAMTGAKNLGTSGNKKNLSFSIGRNSKSITHVKITLTSADLYDVEFINARGAKIKVVKKVKGVYADMLQKIFTKYTGMRTSL